MNGMLLYYRISKELIDAYYLENVTLLNGSYLTQLISGLRFFLAQSLRYIFIKF